MAKRRQKGEGALFQRKSDGLWIGAIDLGWFDGKRQIRRVSSKDYKTARRKLDELKRKIDEHGDVSSSMTVEAWLSYWLDNIAARRLKPSTLTSYRSKVDGLLIPELGKKRLDKLRSSDLRAAYRRLEQTRSSTTVLQAHAILRKALSDATREQPPLVVRNVATLLDAPRKATTERGALTVAEARALLSSEAGGPMSARWAVALLTGARQGEALGLTWEHIDLDAGRLDFAWQLQRIRFRHGCGGTCGRSRGGSCPDRELDVPRGFAHRQLEGGLCLITPKSKSGTRVVPLVVPLEAALRHHAAATDDQSNPHGLVFHRADGRPIDPADDSEEWRAALDRAGLPHVPGHAARHTAATLLHEAGVDGHTVQQILGHSEVTTTRGYQHVDLKMARAALDRMVAFAQLTTD